MQNFEQLGKELERRGKAEDIKRLAQSDESRKLAGMIDAGKLQQAAKNGDTDALRDMLGAVLKTQEGQRLAESVRKMMEK